MRRLFATVKSSNLFFYTVVTIMSHVVSKMTIVSHVVSNFSGAVRMVCVNSSRSHDHHCFAQKARASEMLELSSKHHELLFCYVWRVWGKHTTRNQYRAKEMLVHFTFSLRGYRIRVFLPYDMMMWLSPMSSLCFRCQC